MILAGWVMDCHIKDYYCQYSDANASGNFHELIVLHETSLTWDEVSKKMPTLCKGWYELSRLVTKDRIDFTHEFWMAKLPYHPKLGGFLDTFFASIDDIGIYLFQKKFDDPFEANMVYSLSQDRGFFHGNPPATEQQIQEVKRFFPNEILPLDYMSFLQIHNGFCKATDSTGILSSHQMERCYQSFQMIETAQSAIVTNKGLPVDPKKLIPFYESFGMPFFQCFWADWYPDYEMGNVYYSGFTKTISDIDKPGSYTEMAFPTYTDWLIFYLEKIV